MAWLSPWTTLAQPLAKKAVSSNSEVFKEGMNNPANSS
jgi:hypothetical protein